MAETPDGVVSHEVDGRILSGMGADPEELAAIMDRPAPSEPAASPSPSTPPEAAPPVQSSPEAPQTRGQKRFAELAAERDAARKEAAEIKAAREAAERERDELRARLSRPPEPERRAEPPQPPPPTRPEPSTTEIGAKYDSWEAFQRDHTRWVLEQERAAHAGEEEQRIAALFQQQRERESFGQTVEAVRERGRKVYKDFDALLSGPAGQIPLGSTAQQAWARGRHVILHPQSEHIQYAIVKDASLAQRLQAMDDFAFAAAVEQLVPKSTNGAGVSPASPAVPPPPAPFQPVGQGGTSTTRTSEDIANSGGSYEEFKAARSRERASRR